MIRRIAVTVLFSVMLAGCAFDSGDPVVDGWPIGPEMACTPEARCPQKLAVATAELDRRDPGHAAVVAATLHDAGTIKDSFGNPIGQVHSGGCCSVARFTLADSSVKAIGVGTVGIDPSLRPIDYGP